MSPENVAGIHHTGVIGEEVWHKKEQIMVKLFSTCDEHCINQIQEIQGLGTLIKLEDTS